MEQLLLNEVLLNDTSPSPHNGAYQKSFLKWAGGKYKLLPRILAAIPDGKRLIEPFAGSAVVSLNAPHLIRLASDSNNDLINLYHAVATNYDEFVSECSLLFTAEHNTRVAFEELRHEFNNSIDPFRRSVIFVYLNRHCFNGLCRYNSKGRFNVPFGKYTNPQFPLREVTQFKQAAASIIFNNVSFEQAMLGAKNGDVVYCDPPYVPLSLTSNFTSYTEGSFGPTEQRRLAELARELQSGGIPVVISNHDTEFTRELYKGSIIESFGVQRNISSDGANRGRAPELLAIFK